jgi:hypothetical protein
MPRPLQQRAEGELGRDRVDSGIGGPDLVPDQAAGTGTGQRDIVDPGTVQQGVYANAAANASPRVAAVSKM